MLLFIFSVSNIIILHNGLSVKYLQFSDILWKNTLEICPTEIIVGIAVAAEYKIGQELIQNKNFKEYNDFYEKVLELGRRHKIMNPGNTLYW